MRRIASVLFAVFFCLAASAAVKPGDVPPDALGKTRDGQPVTVSSLRGKVVVVSFWATWCRYCMKEMPVLVGVQQLATERRLPLQVVSVNSMESRQTFVHSARALHSRFPELLLSWDSDGAIGKPYGADKGIPVMVMLHRDGTVAHVHVGYGEDMLESLLAEINALLAEPEPPAATQA
ncbi:redoxin [Frateuria sp. Soil773]|uniref:TlpA family protein disulfide reductase n=1 Tax=Frateuria sp. Soil773 TaxID=1736407 RepID=UPI0006F773C0|nr:TlpA disulfide reductase family protein [Frateuria sp. Soil773]KRE98588.1 redoxin [Frateuria sp. Soil773]